MAWPASVQASATIFPGRSERSRSLNAAALRRAPLRIHDFARGETPTAWHLYAAPANCFAAIRAGHDLAPRFVRQQRIGMLSAEIKPIARAGRKTSSIKAVGFLERAHAA